MLPVAPGRWRAVNRSAWWRAAGCPEQGVWWCQPSGDARSSSRVGGGLTAASLGTELQTIRSSPYHAVLAHVPALSGSSTRRLLLATEADRLETSPARPACRPAAGQTGTAPVFTVIRSAKEGPSLLCGIATATPQHFTVTSRQTATCQPRSLRRHDGSRVCPLRGPCPPDSIRQALRDLMTLVPLVHVLATPRLSTASEV